MVRWIAGAASLHVGLVLFIFVSVVWLAPSPTMKNMFDRCQDLHAASPDELPGWVQPETSMDAAFDIPRQRLTCTWTSDSQSHVWTYDTHGTRAKLALSGIALLGLGSVVGGLLWRKRERAGHVK